MKVISYRLKEWFNRSSNILFITSIYPGSGKTTLSTIIANKYNAKLLQLDELYTFLRLDKWFPNIAKGLNIKEFEEVLYKDTMIRNYYRYNSLMYCIDFFKEVRRDLYTKLFNHRFGEKYYLIGENYWFDNIWSQWTNWVIRKIKDSNSIKPVIIEGGQLNTVLLEDINKETLLVNTPLVIIKRNKYIALYNKAYKKICEEYRGISKVNRYYKSIKWYIESFSSSHLQKINTMNEYKLDDIVDILSKRDSIKVEKVYNFMKLSLFKNRMKYLR